MKFPMQAKPVARQADLAKDRSATITPSDCCGPGKRCIGGCLPIVGCVGACIPDIF